MSDTYCRYHCGACGTHFTSLKAFDSHRSGPHSDRVCELADDAEGGLRELTGTCRVAYAEDRSPVTVYEHAESADANRARFAEVTDAGE